MKGTSGTSLLSPSGSGVERQKGLNRHFSESQLLAGGSNRRNDLSIRSLPYDLSSPSARTVRKGKSGTSLPKIKSPLSHEGVQRSATEPRLGTPPQHLVLMLKRGSPKASLHLDELDVSDRIEPAPRGTNRPHVLPALQSLPGAKAQSQELPSSRPDTSGSGKHRKVGKDLHISWSSDGQQPSLGNKDDALRPLSRGSGLPEAKSPTLSARYTAASQEISKVARGINKDLASIMLDMARKQEAARPRAKVAPQIDPVLQRALQVADAARSGRSTMPADAEEDDQGLREISVATQTVHDNLTRLMEEMWARKVWSTPPGDDPEFEKADETPGNKDKPVSAESIEDQGSAAVGPAEEAGVQEGNEVEDGFEIDGLPSLMERLKRFSSSAEGGGKEGLSEGDKERMRTAFYRFKAPDSGDLHRDELVNLLQYLGHVFTDAGDIEKILREVTRYDDIDLEEFQEFMQKYETYEKEEFRKVFVEFDDDGSGEISIAELRKLTAHLGITPLRAMMKEALEMVDADGNGQLNYEELMRFLVVYRHAEGFTRAEVAELRKVYNRSLSDGRLPVSSLSDALVRVFGLQAEAGARAIVAHLEKAVGDDEKESEPEGLLFNEFLIFARRTREAQESSLKNTYMGKGDPRSIKDKGEQAEFEAVDTDGSGMISESELRKALVDQGYAPLKWVLQEVYSEVLDGPWTLDRELDFHEFFDFMLVYRQREGFAKAEAEELMETFRLFDEDGSEEINALELADMFRHLGYTLTMDEVHLFVGQVDANGSGDLDFREFIKLMRIHRTADVNKIKHAFDNYKRDGVLLKTSIIPALLNLQHDPPKTIANGIEEASIGLDDFVALVDQCRADWVLKQRRKSGYSDAEIDEFRESFRAFDKDGSGEIDTKELQQLLIQFGWQPKTKQDQQELIKRLGEARQVAKEAGVQEEELSKIGANEITFWEFVQLARMLQKQHDVNEHEKLQALIAELKFSSEEIDQFRQVFTKWVGEAPPDNAHQTVKKTIPCIHPDRVRRRLRSIGVNITAKNQPELDAKIASCCDEGQFVFNSFLRVMRWLVDTNFGDVNAGVKSSNKA